MIFSLLSLVPWVVFVALLMVNFKMLALDTKPVDIDSIAPTKDTLASK